MMQSEKVVADIIDAQQTISGDGSATASLAGVMRRLDGVWILVRRAAGLIQLFDPPFDKSALNPGYIKGYIPGVRENVARARAVHDTVANAGAPEPGPERESAEGDASPQSARSRRRTRTQT